MAKRKVKDIDLGYRHIMDEIRLMAKSHVTVGIHEKEGAYPNNTPIALIAAVHEFGTSTAGKGRNIVIPERSYLRAVFNTNLNSWVNSIKELRDNIFVGKETVSRSLKKMGILITSQVRSKIDKMLDPPYLNGNKPKELKASTIEAKRLAKGEVEKDSMSVEKPLIMTRTLYTSINFETKIQ